MNFLYQKGHGKNIMQSSIVDTICIFLLASLPLLELLLLLVSAAIESDEFLPFLALT